MGTGASIKLTTSQTGKAFGVWHTVPFSVALFENGGNFWDVGDSTKFTVPADKAGFYWVTAFASLYDYPLDAKLRILKNGTTPIYVLGSENNTARTNTICGLCLVDMAANDYIELQVYVVAGTTNFSIDGVAGAARFGLHIVEGGASEDIGAHAVRTTNQVIPSRVNTAISFDSELYDTDTMWNAANPTRLTIKTAGTYIIGGHVSWDYTATDAYNIYIYVNGVTLYSMSSNRTVSKDFDSSISTILDLSVNDYLELFVYARPAVGATVLANNSGPCLWARSVEAIT